MKHIAIIRHSFRNLLSKCRYNFQSDNNDLKNKNLNDTHKVNKPKAEEQEDLDMRGNKSMDRLNQNQKSYSPLHSQQINPFSLHFIASKLPNKFVQLLGNMIESPKTQIASDSLNLPKMESQSIPVYDILTYKYFLSNRMWVELVPLSIFFVSTDPFLSTFSAITGYLLYLTLYWSKIKNVAIKIELLPHKQEIKILLANSFAKLYTKTFKIQDFQMITLDQFDWLQKKLFNEYIVIRHKLTGELILFEKQGIWHEEGINHELLN